MLFLAKTVLFIINGSLRFILYARLMRNKESNVLDECMARCLHTDKIPCGGALQSAPKIPFWSSDAVVRSSGSMFAGDYVSGVIPSSRLNTSILLSTYIQ